jgi:hypothetical protein
MKENNKKKEGKTWIKIKEVWRNKDGSKFLQQYSSRCASADPMYNEVRCGQEDVNQFLQHLLGT